MFWRYGRFRSSVRHGIRFGEHGIHFAISAASNLYVASLPIVRIAMWRYAKYQVA